MSEVLSRLRTAQVPPTIHNEDFDPLPGRKVGLIVDGKPISFISKKVMLEKDSRGVDVLSVTFHTTMEAIDNPSIDAKIEAAKAGFEIGESVQYRQPGKNPSGVVNLVAFEPNPGTHYPDEYLFRAQALTPIHRFEGNNVELVSERGALFWVSPEYLQHFESAAGIGGGTNG